MFISLVQCSISSFSDKLANKNSLNLQSFSSKTSEKSKHPKTMREAAVPTPATPANGAAATLAVGIRHMRPRPGAWSRLVDISSRCGQHHSFTPNRYKKSGDCCTIIRFFQMMGSKNNGGHTFLGENVGASWPHIPGAAWRCPRVAERAGQREDWPRSDANGSWQHLHGIRPVKHSGLGCCKWKRAPKLDDILGYKNRRFFQWILWTL